MKRIYFFACFFILTKLSAQTIITGSIQTSDHSALPPGISIIAYPQHSPTIISYALSDKEGKYKIRISNNPDSFDLEVSHIGYTTVRKTVLNKNVELDFLIQKAQIELPVVSVEGRQLIAKKGDTLNYDVNKFTAPTDKVIGDIIRKLPGIQIDANGLIKYNGKAISNYYIENLDLLESKYNIANNNIPADMVDMVQILENYQPIKALDSFSISDRAAINIKLNPKAKNKLIVLAKPGIGLPPLLWNNELITLNFNKKFQFINGGKSNNDGSDLRNEITDLTVNPNDQLLSLQEKRDIVSFVDIGTPPFDKNRYFFNQSNLVYSNGIFLLAKATQLRYNVSYSNEYVSKFANRISTYFLPESKLVIQENQEQHQNSNDLFSDLSLTVNKAKFFFKDNLKLKGYMDAGFAKTQDSGIVNQQLKNALFEIINNAHVIFGNGGIKYEVNSNFIFKNLPQNLKVYPGQYPEFLNDGIEYDYLQQFATLQTFATDNYISFRKRIYHLIPKIKIGFQYKEEVIKSKLQKSANGTQSELPVTFKNELKGKEIIPYGEVNLLLTQKKYSIEVNSHAESRSFFKNDAVLKTNNWTHYFFLNNIVSVKRDIGPYYNLSVYLSNNSDIISGMENTSGYILKTYRNISRDNSALDVKRTYTTGIYLTYRNAIKSLFGFLNTSYSSSTKNLLTRVDYLNKLENQSSVNEKNQSHTIYCYLNISKYLKRSKTNLSFYSNLTSNTFEEILQNQLSVIRNYIVENSFNISNKKSAVVYPEYSLVFTKFISLISPQSEIHPQPSTRIVHKLDVSFFLTDKIIFTPSVCNYIDKLTNQTSFNSVLLNATLLFKKKKYNCELKFTNLSNVKNFSISETFENTQSTTVYRLRPVSVMLKFNFQF